jgi:outer membrane lipoprotein-sorting protein
MNNDCHRFRDQIADLVAGIQPELEGRELQDHLSTCAPCREYWQALKREDAALTEYFAGIDEAIPDRQERLLQMIACSHANRKTKTTSIWRGIVKNRYSRLVTAAAILTVTAATMMVLDKSTSPAYAITDLPRAFEQARVIHVQGWNYFPEHRMRDGRRIPPLEINEWIDGENSRSRYTGGGLSIDAEGNVTVTPCESISDGNYQMSINHGQKWAKFYRMSSYKQKLTTYETSKLVSGQLFGNVALLANSVVVGHELIDGVACDIWQVDVAGATPGHTTRTKHWLAADTGQLVRAQVLSRMRDGKWELDEDYQTIEYNVEIPESTFAMEPPEGYTTENNKETAPILDIASGGVAYKSLWCSLVINFTLSDGSVVMGWRSFDSASEQPQELLFKDLMFGGPLPKLPVEIHGVVPAGVAGDVTYAGYHLAYTHKGDEFDEWSLYVPDGVPPGSVKELGYTALYRFNLDPQPKWIIGLMTEYGVPIETAEDFDTWVLGAMAELSDTGMAPSHVTYEAVLNLVQQVRSTTKR